MSKKTPEVVLYRCTRCRAEVVLVTGVTFACKYCGHDDGAEQYRHSFDVDEELTMKWECSNEWLNEFFRAHRLEELTIEKPPRLGCSVGWWWKVWRNADGKEVDRNTKVHGCYDGTPSGTPVLKFTAPTGEEAGICVTHFLYKFGDYPDSVARVLAAVGLTEISEEIHAEVAKMRAKADEKVNRGKQPLASSPSG